MSSNVKYSKEFVDKVRYLMSRRCSKKLDDTYAQFSEDERPLFTELIVECGADPLEYLDNIPAYFAFNTSLYKELKVPNHIKSIGEYAFLNAGLIRVYTGHNIESIEEGAFASNDSLKELYLDNKNTLKRIGRGAFSNCSNLEGTIIWSGIEEIDSQAFALCRHMKELRLFPSIKRIGDAAFRGCNELEVWYHGTFEQFKQVKVDDSYLTHVHCLLNTSLNDWVLYELD